MGDLKNILSGNEEPLSEEDLLKYLENDSSLEERHSLNSLAEGSFESDALEGLKQIENTEKVKRHVKQLNQKLQKQLQAKRQRKEKGKIKDFQWIIITLLLLIFICIVGYVLIRMSNNAASQHSSNMINTEQVKAAQIT